MSWRSESIDNACTRDGRRTGAMGSTIHLGQKVMYDGAKERNWASDAS